MISLPPSVRIYLYTERVDGRKGMDSLSALVRSTLNLDPLSGHLFLFVAAQGKCARILFYDHNGFVLYTKRLESGRFHVPNEIPESQTHVTIEASEMVLLLEGIDLRGAKRRARWDPPLATSVDAMT